MIPLLPALPRFLNWQGAFGIAASLCLFGLLLVQKGDTRHWRKQSQDFEANFRAEQRAHAQTVANYRAASETARLADAANRDRVISAQADINERTIHDYEARLGDARTVADRLRRGAAADDRGVGRAAAVPAPGAAARAAGSAAPESRLSLADRLIATEQAIQLDELIKWVRAQGSVDTEGRDPSDSEDRGR